MGDLEIENSEQSLSTGPLNNFTESLPWLQPLLGAYYSGGVGSYQVRVVRG